MRLRNAFYDNGLFKKQRPALRVISVGNLTVGGTGKTPMVEFLIKRYGSDRASGLPETATLSRGYGRITTGFRIATDADTAATLGDEPLQLYRKFGRFVCVCVGERRADALHQMQQRFPQLRRVLLDDAYQHRAVDPHLNLLLSDYNRPFYADYPFPAGRLREGRAGAARADAVIITKCPGALSADEQQQIRWAVHRYSGAGVPVLFAGLRYGQPVAYATQQPTDKLRAVVLVSGLANADPLDTYVRQTFDLLTHHRFADHYAYKRADLDRLLADQPPGAALLTTEKDWVKLDALLTTDERATLPLYYLPVSVQFLPGYEQEFGRLLDAFDAGDRPPRPLSDGARPLPM
ncbi:tetraacyldisaccharide 4'-kinase [Spirosoma rhododendri]|nr:tetraacyldisaccharide 4'-kinase [Spirosoma rhododendri]